MGQSSFEGIPSIFKDFGSGLIEALNKHFYETELYENLKNLLFALELILCLRHISVIKGPQIDNFLQFRRFSFKVWYPVLFNPFFNALKILQERRKLAL